MTPVTPTSSNRKLTSESNRLQEHECDRDRCQTVECACADTSPACVAPPSEIVDVSDHGCAKRGREWGDVEWRGTTPTSDSFTEHIRSSSRSRTHADDEKIVDGLDVKSSQPEDAEGTSATMGIQPARAERTPSPGSSDATYYSNGDAKELSISCHLHPQGTPSETDDPQVVPSLLKSRSATDGCALEVQGISPEGAQIELSVPVLDSPI